MLIDIRKNKVKVADWINTWLAQKAERVQCTTIQNYKALLQPVQTAFVNIALEELHQHEIQRYLDGLVKQGQTSKAIHTLELLKPVLEEAVQKKLIADNPARNIVVLADEEKEKVLSIEEQQYFLQALRGERLEYFFLVALYTGFRPGEICGLQWPKINWEEGVVLISNAVRREKHDGRSKVRIAPTKTHRSYEILLSQTALQLLTAQKRLQENEVINKQYNNTHGLVFTTRKGTPLENSSINRTLKRVQNKMRKLYAEEHGIPIAEAPKYKFSAKALRHTYATRALESGVPLKVVSDMLGHSSVRITGDVYTHVNNKTMQINTAQVEDYLNSIENYINEIVCFESTQKDIQK